MKQKSYCLRNNMLITWEKSSGALQNMVWERTEVHALNRFNPCIGQHRVLSKSCFHHPCCHPVAARCKDRRAKGVLVHSVLTDRDGKCWASPYISLPPIKMLSVEAPCQRPLQGSNDRDVFISETRVSCHLLTGTCFRKGHREMWTPAVFQFAHIWKLLVTQLWKGVGRGPMVFHTLHWKGF